MKPLRLAVDTNVLLDLADGVERVLDAFTVISQRLPESEKLVVPSVLDELAFLCDFAESRRIRASARKALGFLRDARDFRPLLELPVSPDLVEELAAEIRGRSLLPTEEVHDSLILAEAAFLDCGLLLSGDEHLRSVDHELLTLILNPRDLTAPVIASPGEIVRKFFH